MRALLRLHDPAGHVLVVQQLPPGLHLELVETHRVLRAVQPVEAEVNADALPGNAHVAACGDPQGVAAADDEGVKGVLLVGLITPVP